VDFAVIFSMDAFNFHTMVQVWCVCYMVLEIQLNVFFFCPRKLLEVSTLNTVKSTVHLKRTIPG